MPYFKLVNGSHNVGSGTESKTYRSNDMYNNVVESDEDLAAEMPEKFIPWHGPAPTPRRGRKGKPGEAPKPPTDVDRAISMIVKPGLTADQMEEAAEKLAEQARQLKESAAHAKALQNKKPKAKPEEDEEEGDEDEDATPKATASEAEAEEEDEDAEDLNALTVPELKERAKAAGVTGYASMAKADLVKAVEEAEDGQ